MENPMNNLARLNPFSELRDPFSDDFFKGFALRPVYRLMEGEPQMRLDLSEDDKNFFVKAEIPGVNKDDIKVSVDGNLVSVSAEVRKVVHQALRTQDCGVRAAGQRTPVG
jgi:HSP20 family protein